jgi:hypothetical protein
MSDPDAPAIPPRPLCATCGVEMWLVMMPPRPTATIKEDWVFQCPVCTAIATVAEPSTLAHPWSHSAYV